MSLPDHPIEATTKVSISLRDWLSLIGTIVVLVAGGTYQIYSFQEENRVQRKELARELISVVKTAVREDTPWNKDKEGVLIRFEYGEKQTQKNSEQIAAIATTVTQLAVTIAEQQKTNLRIADSLEKNIRPEVYKKIEMLEKQLESMKSQNSKGE